VVRPAFYSDELPDNARDGMITWGQKYLDRLQQENRPDHLRAEAMNSVNPLYVLRNYLAQQAIDKAEQGDQFMIHELQEVLKKPYSLQDGKEHLAGKRPEWARTRAGCSMLSCSS
jgi:uncharacterized protein YdiU (UPF0061 family)